MFLLLPPIFHKLILPNMYIFAGFIFLALVIGGGFLVVSSGGDTKATEKECKR